MLLFKLGGAPGVGFFRDYSGGGKSRHAKPRSFLSHAQSFGYAGIADSRFARLEGVADTEPMFPEDPMDPRNRRMSVTLLRG